MGSRSVVLLLVLSTACGGAGMRRFGARSIMWDDDDRRAFTPPPAASSEPYFWDAIDHLVFRPASELWTFTPKREAINVNALDEVPDSSWYVNRLSRRAMSSEEIARGACERTDVEVPAPWRVLSGKPDGATPGFVFEDAHGVRYLLKVDRPGQREQATAADAIVAAVYHAAGYYVPCNRIVGFSEEMLELHPRARAGGEPMGWGDIQEVLDVAGRLEDGRYRAVVSRFVGGEPLGPWSYLGTREGDPNDVVPHDARRELRGMFVLSAWVNHWDSRDNNTLSSWITADHTGRGYVRHYLVDFGESLGLIEGGARRELRFGHSQWIDAQHVVEDALTLGLLARPWLPAGGARRELGPAGESLGYFDDHPFAPDQWRPDYWNGAFERHTERDAAWMARIVARFTRADLEALTRLGHYADPIAERELVRILASRRRAILERYLTRLSPLSDPRLDDGELCLTDLAVSSHLRWPEDRSYASRVIVDGGELRAPVRVEDGGVVCAAVPEVDHDYLVIEQIASTRERETTGPVHVHLARTPRGLALVGLERS
jgi:hypothetical protein